MTSIKRLAAIFQLILLVFGIAISVRAAGEVDTSFRANLTRMGGSGAIRKIAVQPDGKILIVGTLGLVNGVFRSQFARLNTDGTVDVTFTPPTIIGQFDILAIAFQPNGKILVGGNFRTATRRGIMRLNSDGSLDPTFVDLLPIGGNSFGGVFDIATYPDGRMIIGGDFSIQDLPGGGVRGRLARIDADGNVDMGFEYNETTVRRVLLLPDGKVIAAASFEPTFPQSYFIRRRNPDGSNDNAFATHSATGLSDLALLADGKLLVSGGPGTPLFRINTDGTTDNTYTAPNVSGSITVMIPDGSGKFYIGGDFSQIGGNTAYKKIARLNGDGSLDAGFVSSGQNFPVVNDMALQSDGKFVVGGNGMTVEALLQDPVARFNPDGSLDAAFHVPVGVNFGIGYKVVVQPDNKVIVGGTFDLSNGVRRGRLARFNTDGTLDTGFTPPDYTQGTVYDIALQPDGKILIVGTMGVVHRLNSNGTLDVAFPASTVNQWDVDYMPDGRVLVAGQDIRRYTSAGAFESLVASISGGTLPEVNEIALQPDGKILVGGSFTQINLASRNGFARLNADTSIDASFNPQTNGAVYSIVLLADGKILIGGAFTSVGGDPTKQYIARLNADGSVDSSFSPALNAPVFGFKVQADGRILVGGAMSHVNGILMPRVARIYPNGILDTTFNVGTGPDSTVWSIDQQSDGKVVYSGECVRTNGFATPGIGRMLNNAVSLKKLFDYDGDGKSDVSVFRAAENKWYVLRSSDGTIYQPVFAAAGDIPVPADYDGDQKTDVAIFRPSNGQWWYLSSIDGSQIANPFGGSGDIPRPSDFDGDGKADLVRFRPSNNTWYRFGSTAGNVPNVVFGQTGDQPVIGDFDGDGKSDLAVFRPSNGDWWYAASSAGGEFRTVHWGQTGDLPVPADFDGDGKTDYAVYRPSEGGWYIYNSGGSFTTTAFGIDGDRPIAADYDGDGRADIAVFRPSTGIWYLLRSTSGFTGLQFGISTDTPTPNSFVP